MQNIEGAVVRIAFDTAAETEFDYPLPNTFGPMESGQHLQVPFGRVNKPLAVPTWFVLVIDNLTGKKGIQNGGLK